MLRRIAELLPPRFNSGEPREESAHPPIVADSTISTAATLPIADTTIDDTTDQTVLP
jgi:hypothetical protein